MAVLCALPLCFCHLVTIITYYLGYCKQKSDNFSWRRCGEKSLRRRFCALRAVDNLVSMAQIRSYVHPLCDIWAAPHGYIFLLRSFPHNPNRARRAQSAHVPNCGYVPNRGNGGRTANHNVTIGRRPPCGVRDAAKRLPVRFIRTGGAFLGTLDRSAERSRASPRSGRSKGPTDAQRPWGGVTRKGESSGPGYAGHIQGMCRRPLCPFLRFIKIF